QLTPTSPRSGITRAAGSAASRVKAPAPSSPPAFPRPKCRGRRVRARSGGCRLRLGGAGHARRAWRLTEYDPSYTSGIPRRREGMAKAATKIAISVPDELYRAVERARRSTGLSRSAVVQRALRLWLERSVHETAVREYVAGYRARPE